VKHKMFVFLGILGAVLLMGSGAALLAQGAAPAVVEVDLPAQIEIAMSLLVTGVGGLSVTALVSLIKRALHAEGVFTVIISIVVSVGVVLIYLIPVGFVLWKFLVLSGLVALAANGIYLTPQKRNK